MNHLAHCFLSFGNEELLLGNFIGDYVKGNDWATHPPVVQQGILLHRTIDSFTDGHERVHLCTARIRPYAGKFSGPVVDILFDHLLALSWEKYSTASIAEFSANTYRQLENRSDQMPAILATSLPKMVAGDFLQGYLYREGLEFVFSKFARRLPWPVDFDALLAFFFENLPEFRADFDVFFPELLDKAKFFAGIK